MLPEVIPSFRQKQIFLLVTGRHSQSVIALTNNSTSNIIAYLLLVFLCVYVYNATTN